MVDRKQFVKNLGFVDDPFAYIDADNEVRLPEYFVRPPYFSEVFGDPDNASSFFAFAPRGGGKTAQRIMIERQCAASNVLAITYIDFDYFGCTSVQQITLEQHIRRVLAAGWLGILASLYEDQSRVSRVSDYGKFLVMSRLEAYVKDMVKAEYASVLDSLNGRFTKFVNENAVNVGAIHWNIDVILKKVFGPDKPETLFDAGDLDEPGEFYAKDELKHLIGVAKEIGYRSIYVLIDRIDESELTGNSAGDSFELIKPLVKSHRTLETPGIGFKFFLWDAIEPHFKGVGRSDRIDKRKLDWTPDRLSKMLNKRLRAHSEGSINHLEQIADSLSPFSIDDLAIMFAQESPRDLLRICRKIVAEQEQLNGCSDTLSGQSVSNGLNGVCRTLLEDRIADKHLDQLVQVGTNRDQVDFTVSHLVKSLKISTLSARSRIQKWKDAGAIIELGRVANPDKTKGTTVKLYGVTDVRLARLMCSQLSTSEFVMKKVRKCKNGNCSRYVCRDWEESDSMQRCHECGYDWFKDAIDRDYVPAAEAEDEISLPTQLRLLGVQDKS